MKYAVIYLWQGERHRHLETFTTWAKAHDTAIEFRKKKFRAWVESCHQ